MRPTGNSFAPAARIRQSRWPNQAQRDEGSTALGEGAGGGRSDKDVLPVALDGAEQRRPVERPGLLSALLAP